MQQGAHYRLSIRGMRVVESVAMHNAARDTNSSVTENGSAAVEDLRYTGISSVQVSTKMFTCHKVEFDFLFISRK